MECQNPFKIVIGSTASICPNCIANKNKDINNAAKNLKNSIKYSRNFEFNLDSPDQKLIAVRAQGEVFASKGGVDLMITEFVENSFDAIKKSLMLQYLPEAIKQMSFTQQFEKIAIEIHTTRPLH